MPGCLLSVAGLGDQLSTVQGLRDSLFRKFQTREDIIFFFIMQCFVNAKKSYYLMALCPSMLLNRVCN